MKTAGFVILTLALRHEEGCWTAECLELGTSTFADTLEEAQEAILEALQLHLQTLADVGELRRFFQKHHITFHSVRPSPRSEVRIPLGEDTYYKPVIQRICAPSGERLLHTASD